MASNYIYLIKRSTDVRYHNHPSSRHKKYGISQLTPHANTTLIESLKGYTNRIPHYQGWGSVLIPFVTTTFPVQISFTLGLMHPHEFKMHLPN